MIDSATAAQIANTGQVPSTGEIPSAIISSAGDIQPSSISDAANIISSTGDIPAGMITSEALAGLVNSAGELPQGIISNTGEFPAGIINSAGEIPAGLITSEALAQAQAAGGLTYIDTGTANLANLAQLAGALSENQDASQLDITQTLVNAAANGYITLPTDMNAQVTEESIQQVGSHKCNDNFSKPKMVPFF